MPEYTIEQWWDDLGSRCSQYFVCIEEASSGSVDCVVCRELAFDIIKNFKELEAKAKSNRKEKNATGAVSESG